MKNTHKLEVIRIRDIHEVNKGIYNYLLKDFYPEEAFILTSRESKLGFDFANGECTIKIIDSFKWHEFINFDEYMKPKELSALFNFYLKTEIDRREQAALLRPYKHRENFNDRQKSRFNAKYANKFYAYNKKVYQIIWAKKENVGLRAEYVEKPSNRRKALIIQQCFIRAKIQKPSGRCTEILIPEKEFLNREFFNTPTGNIECVFKKEVSDFLKNC